jgi:hypothetical protein
MSSYDPLNDLRKSFDSPTSRLSKEVVRQTTRSAATRAGQYDRKTITLPPEQIAYIDQVRKEAGIGVLAFYRWLIDQGLQNYENGSRPNPEPDVIHDLQMGHWSSKNNE